MSGDDMRERMGAAIRRVDGILVSPDAARLTVYFLGKHAEETRQRNGCPPLGLIDLQHFYAEAIVSDSRRREPSGSGALELVAFEHEQQSMGTAEAAAELGVSADTVRWHARKGNLDGRRFGRQLLITVASVHALKERLRIRRGT